MAAISTSIDCIILWLSRIFGALNLPIAFIAIIDLSAIILIRDIPRTPEQWTGFLTAITVLAGVIAGLTVKSKHSPNRKMAHLLIAALGLFLTLNALIRIIINVLFIDWL